MEKKSVSSEHGTTYYWVGGNDSENSQCIVFTHGMTADHTMFDKQIEYFREEYKIITWDVPLHGESRPYKEFSYKNLAQELNCILNTEGIHKIILVGQSMGGYVCQEFSIQYPEKVKAFVAVDTNPFGHYYYSKWDRYILTKVGGLSSWFPYNILTKSIAKQSTKTKYAYENLYNSVCKLSKKEIVFIMDMAYGEFLNRKATAKFSFPVLLIIGDGDNTGKVKEYNQQWSQKEGYPLKIIKDAAHASNVDNYENFNDTVSKFLSEL